MHCTCITKRKFKDGFHFPALLRVPAMSKRAVGFHLKSRCGDAMQTSRMSDAQCGHKSDQVATLNCRLGDKETRSRSAVSTAVCSTAHGLLRCFNRSVCLVLVAFRRKTRGTSTQVPWHSSDLCPVGKNFFRKLARS